LCDLPSEPGSGIDHGHERILSPVRQTDYGGSVTCLLGVVIAALALAAPAQAGQTRLLVPPDGQSYFGFTFRLWDTSDQAWGDARTFDVRIHDSFANELAGKAPTFRTVWATWQERDRAGR